MTQATRIEHDLVGDKGVRSDAYYGVHTVRAVENFTITGSTIAGWAAPSSRTPCPWPSARNSPPTPS